MIRAQPMDSVVLVGGCDKTVPAQLMGALSAGKPAISLVTGPMLDRPFRRRAARRVHRLPFVLGALPRRRTFARADRRDRVEPCDHRGHVRRDGNGEHDGLRHRGARDEFARLGHAARGARRALARRRSDGPARGRARRRRPHARSHRDACERRKRVARPLCAGRFDERGHSSHRDRRAPLDSADARALQRDQLPTRRCSSTSNPSAKATWKTSTPPAECVRCCTSSRPSCTARRFSVAGETLDERLARESRATYVDRCDHRAARASRWSNATHSSRCSETSRRTARF